MSELHTYDSKDCIFMLGLEQVTGFGTDSKFTITLNSDISELEDGVDGDQIISFLNQKSGTAELNLMYGCKWDNTLDQCSGLGKAGLVNFQFLHKPSFKTCAGVASIKEQPAVAVGTTPENRTWVLNLTNASMSVSDSAKAVVTGVKFGVEGAGF
ncbi:MAG: hypothetical protein GY928_23630 [Colwellia sp.]|nr:hypothetical protein [Colwellia sp.]